MYRPRSPETPFWMVHPVCWSCSGTAHDIFHSNPLSDNPLFYSPPPPFFMFSSCYRSCSGVVRWRSCGGSWQPCSKPSAPSWTHWRQRKVQTLPAFKMCPTCLSCRLHPSTVSDSISLASCSHDGVHKCCQWQQATYAIAAMVNRDVSMLHSVCQQACDKKTDHAGCSRHGQDGWCG